LGKRGFVPTPSVRSIEENEMAEKEKLLGDPILDSMMGVVMRLARELYVTRDRLEVMEQLMERKGVFAAQDIERYQPDEQARASIAARRDEFIENILEPLT